MDQRHLESSLHNFSIPEGSLFNNKGMGRQGAGSTGTE